LVEGGEECGVGSWLGSKEKSKGARKFKLGCYAQEIGAVLLIYHFPWGDFYMEGGTCRENE